MADPITDPEGYAAEQLRAWCSALEAVQQGQEYTIGGVRNGRTLRRADLKEVRETVDYWRAQHAKAKSGSGGIRTFFVVPQ